MRTVTHREWRCARSCAAALLIGGALVLLPGQVAGQEVAGDVMIPPPREMVSSTAAASGLGTGDATAGAETMAEYRAALESVVEQVRAGTMGEGDTRKQLGDVVVSLLVRAGVLTF